MTKQQLDKVYKVVEENEWVAKLTKPMACKLLKKIKKPIDKPKRVCYNKYIIKKRLWYYEVYH